MAIYLLAASVIAAISATQRQARSTGAASLGIIARNKIDLPRER